MLNESLIEHILTSIPAKTIGLVGDLFLDRYLDIDASLTEPSIETGLDAYQITDVRSLPGALGTVINNLVALGVGNILPFTIIGDDGEGYELRQALHRMPAVRSDGIVSWDGRRTPTYTKPMLYDSEGRVGGLLHSRPLRELNRLDIKNRAPTPLPAIEAVRDRLKERLHQLDALIVLDQVSEAECGVIATPLRHWLAEFGRNHPDKFILADSRERIGLFRNVHIKPNTTECLKAAGLPADLWQQALRLLTSTCGRSVFCMRGNEGMAVLTSGESEIQCVPGYPVSGPIDIVGAGDSCSAGIVCATVSGAQPREAAAFGNLIASITIQQIGVTGTASPAQVCARWREVAKS
jgi:bifunctional ADP-heptose synthase (sugar kinase/adenylyltransferase)